MTLSDYVPKCKNTLPIIFDDRMPVNNLLPKIVNRVNDNTADTRNLYSETEAAQGDIEDLQEAIAPAYSATSTYAVGAYVMYNNVLYRCTTAIATAEAWTAAHWTEVNVGGELTQYKEDISELQDGKADANGTAENLTAGNAKQLLTDKGVTDKVPYILRASGGNGADREMDKIVGGTVAWNQIAKELSNANWRSETGVTASWNDGVATVESSTANNGIVTRYTSNFIKDHIYVLSFRVKPTSAISVRLSIPSGFVAMISASANAWNDCTKMVKCTATSNASLYIYPYQVTGTFDVKEVMVLDLTQMFGTAIANRAYALDQVTAGSGIAWLKSMGFFTADYYPYDAGTLKSVEGLTAHSMVGFNQWDEEWRNGIYNISNGSFIANNTYFANKNPIQVMSNTTYYIGSSVNATWEVFYYDADMNYIRFGQITNSTFVTSQNDCYINFSSATAFYGTTYNHDICINLSDPAKNGTYEPYVKHSYPLDSTLTLRGIPKLDANNQVYYGGDEYASDGTVTRKYGIVDLGTLSWNQFNATLHIAYASIPSIKFGSPATIGINIISDKLQAISVTQFDADATVDKTACVNDTSAIVWVRLITPTTVEEFKSALSGTYLVYELATPTTETADPYQNPQILDPYGTEAYETTGIVPVGHETFYLENLRAKIEGLPFNFATLIAPTETSYKATRAYSTNNLFIVNNILYKATTSIASGGTITPGTNCTATTLAEIIAAL